MTVSATSENAKGAIVFDCDGTLVSSQESVLHAAGVMVSEILGREVKRDEILKLYTPNMLDFAKRLGLDINDQELLVRLQKRWIEILQTQKERQRPFDGILELLQKLQKANFELYVWTARDRASTTRILTHWGLMSYFWDMRCLDDTTPKPHPRGIEEQVAHWEDKSRVVVIGDSYTDMQGARLFGAIPVGALWEPSARESDLVREGAKLCVKTPLEFQAFLEQHFQLTL